MTRRSISIERRRVEWRFFLSHSLDCDGGSLNREGMSVVPVTDEYTQDILERFMKAIPELFFMRVVNHREFKFSLLGSANWYDVEIKVVNALADELGWESGSYTIDDAPMERLGELKVYRQL